MLHCLPACLAWQGMGMGMAKGRGSGASAGGLSELSRVEEQRGLRIEAGGCTAGRGINVTLRLRSSLLLLLLLLLLHLSCSSPSLLFLPLPPCRAAGKGNIACCWWWWLNDPDQLSISGCKNIFNNGRAHK